MQFKDQSTGFEITLPDGWRKLLLFEHVKGNPFKRLLPGVLTEGPVLVGPKGEAMVIAVQQSEPCTPEAYQDVIKRLAKESDYDISKLDRIDIGGQSHATVVWKKQSEDKPLKTYFLIFGRLVWSISVLLNKDEKIFDKIVKTFHVLPIVRKMME